MSEQKKDECNILIEKELKDLLVKKATIECILSNNQHNLWIKSNQQQAKIDNIEPLSLFSSVQDNKTYPYSATFICKVGPKGANFTMVINEKTKTNSMYYYIYLIYLIYYICYRKM